MYTNLVLLTLSPMLDMFEAASRWPSSPVVPASDPARHGLTMKTVATRRRRQAFRLWLHKCDTLHIFDSSQMKLVNVIFDFEFYSFRLFTETWREELEAPGKTFLLGFST